MDSAVWILVVGFVILLLIGIPVAYSIAISAFGTMVYTTDLETASVIIAQRMATGVDSFSLMAIPFFILAGQLMNRGGAASRLIDLARVFVGPLPGGLLYINIIACMLFGAVSGSAVAAASAIGGSMLPMMNKENYNKGFSAAVNLTSSTTGMLIPPSNIFIVYSLAGGGISIGALFLAGYLPGLLLGLLLAVVVFFQSRNKGYTGEIRVSLNEFFKRFIKAIPSLLLLVVVIGGIVGGIFTATEASAIAVVYTLFVSMVIHKEVKWKDLNSIFLESVSITCIILMLIAGSMAMSWVMSYENIPDMIASSLAWTADNWVVLLVVINIILLIIGVFMDMTPAILIFTPIFLPLVQKLGVHPVHFGMIMVLNLSVGLCTPPVGSVLYVGAAVSKLKVSQLMRPLSLLYVAMIVALFLVTFVPEISLALPRAMGLLE